MFRFSLRDLLWLMLVAAICCAWFVSRRNATVRYQELRTEMQAEVTYSRRAMSEAIAERDEAKRKAERADSIAQSYREFSNDLMSAGFRRTWKSILGYPPE
jgi:uncharacterized membrane protein (DUF106 family)